MTSEQRYDVIPQPKDTCPMINNIQGEAKKIERRLHRYNLITEVEELHDILSDVETFLDNEITARRSSLEEIREHIEKIRDWGQDWKSLCKQSIPPINEDFQI